MKTTKKTIAALSVITAVFFSSCKEMQMLPATITKVDGIKITGASLTSLKGKVKVKINNPNPFDVKLFRSDMEVKLNDIPVGNAGLKRKITIPANSEVEQDLYFKPGYSKMGFADVPKVVNMVKEKELRISLKGNLKEGQRFHKKLVHVDETKTINMEEKAKKVTDFFSMIRKKITKKKKEPVQDTQ